MRPALVRFLAVVALSLLASGHARPADSPDLSALLAELEGSHLRLRAASARVQPAEAGIAPPPDLAAAIERALADSPDIAEMEDRIAAARARIALVRALPEPTISVGAINVPVPSLSLNDDFMTMKMLSFEQGVPAPGKRGTAVAAARAEVEMIAAMHEDHVNRLIAEVADAYLQLAALDARLEIARRSLDRTRRVSESVRDRYRVGQGSLPDALLAGVEETKRTERVRAMEAERAMAAARFNTLQSLSVRAPVAPLALPPPESRRAPERALVETAVGQSPLLRQAESDVKRAESELVLARLEKRPDLKLMASYGQRQGYDDMVGASVGLNLPFLRSSRVVARIAEKRADLSAARSRLAAVRLQLLQEVEEAWITLESETDRAGLYRTAILTQGETAARAAEEAYAVGKIDFQTYVDAVLAADEDEMEAIAREAAILRAEAALQGATGIPFFTGLHAEHAGEGREHERE